MTDTEKPQYYHNEDDLEDVEDFVETFENHKNKSRLNRKNKLKSNRIKQERSLGYEIFTWIRDLSIVVIVVLLLTTFVGEKIRVIGASMEPNIHDGDHFLLNKLSYQLNEPERFDIVAFPYDDEVNYIKRIIGLPGEEIDLVATDHNTYDLYIDGVLIDDIYGMEEIIRPGNQKYPLIVPEGEYFVMGDNRNDSSDSRYLDVGTIDEDVFIGKTFIRIWPFNNFGFVD